MSISVAPLNIKQHTICRLVPDGDLPFYEDWRTPTDQRLNMGGPVLLTLNKRRRWLLPVLVDSAIDQLRQGDTDEVIDARPPIRITHSERIIVPKVCHSHISSSDGQKLTNF